MYKFDFCCRGFLSKLSVFDTTNFGLVGRRLVPASTRRPQVGDGRWRNDVLQLLSLRHLRRRNLDRRDLMTSRC